MPSRRTMGIGRQRRQSLRRWRHLQSPAVCRRFHWTTSWTLENSCFTHAIRRQLFTPNAGYEDDNEAREIVAKALDLDMLDDLENDYLPGTPVHKRLQEVKRNLGIGKATAAAAETKTPKGSSIFKKLPTPKATPKTTARKKKTAPEPVGKYSFLKSLEGQVSREKADNEAYFYRENFAKNKELLAQHLYKLFNAQVFNNELDVPLTWSKLLRNTAGRCINKRKLNQRSSTGAVFLLHSTPAHRELYDEMALRSRTNMGDIMVLSVPELKRQLNAAAV
ncbi:hypothetical protein KR032_008030 [Drosophila birchii]|nr:hypothetical protein KR032_008030 [Drosophila birchii]